mmetsp:Transcript_21524/g.38592  ORF Transcript_21524/g.38592 Transcript_21524/m.38592 type:complete len:90 (+) Transcript_21524:102-371(+)
MQCLLAAEGQIRQKKPGRLQCRVFKQNLMPLLKRWRISQPKLRIFVREEKNPDPVQTNPVLMDYLAGEDFAFVTSQSEGMMVLERLDAE